MRGALGRFASEHARREKRDREFGAAVRPVGGLELPTKIFDDVVGDRQTQSESLAAGHPFAATGGRIVNVAAKLLAQRGSGRALISICAAGGQGVVAILER